LNKIALVGCNIHLLIWRSYPTTALCAFG
jgi:hypothetical protein